MDLRNIALCLGLAFFYAVSPALADRLQLANGDEIQGELIEMSKGQVKFRHAILGEFTVPRSKIHAIELGDKRGGKRIMADGSEAPPETPEEIIDRLINPEINRDKIRKMEKGATKHSTPQGAVDELRRKGVSDQMMLQLQGMFPGFGSPEVQNIFRDKVTGLMSGSLTINDIRDDAIDARDQLDDLMKDLGPNGAALQGYYGILDSFIKRTDPEKPLSLPAIPPVDPIAPSKDLSTPQVQ